jgi:hypothetical protein
VLNYAHWQLYLTKNYRKVYKRGNMIIIRTLNLVIPGLDRQTTSEEINDINLESSSAKQDRYGMLLIWPVNCFYICTVNREQFFKALLTWKINLKPHHVPIYTLSQWHSTDHSTKTRTRERSAPRRSYLSFIASFPPWRKSLLRDSSFQCRNTLFFPNP